MLHSCLVTCVTLYSAFQKSFVKAFQRTHHKLPMEACKYLILFEAVAEAMMLMNLGQNLASTKTDVRSNFESINFLWLNGFHWNQFYSLKPVIFSKFFLFLMSFVHFISFQLQRKTYAFQVAWPIITPLKEDALQEK